MKKFLLSVLGVSGLFLTSLKANGQAFVTQADTLYHTINGLGELTNEITNKTGASFTIQWQVVASDFPADWIPPVGICDNHNCYYNTKTIDLWNGFSGSTFTSDPYKPDTAGTFYLITTLADTNSVGTHYLTVSLNGGGTSKMMTFVVSHNPTGVTTITKSEDNITVYPNPARNQINVVFNPNVDAKTIAICNLIGNVVSVFKVTGTSAGMNIENLPTGVYFMRIINSQGAIISTRRFSHQ
ncbi:MAG TPA: T9SS type A sorting domain-containing protein [Flavipsychrobacter sp.]|nr:T9SS type A sorting domain-containing protein [Flavipsychrobacter sp.]